jgi:hypothetical protein
MTIYQKGSFITKEAPADKAQADAMLAPLHAELVSINTAIEKHRKDLDQQYTDLNTHFTGVKGDTDSIRADVLKHVADYAEMKTRLQAYEQGLDQVRKEIDSPFLKGGSDLVESDTKAAIELQKRAYVYKGGDPDEFKPDMENLVNPQHYRSAVRKLVKRVGLEAKRKVVASFDEFERKAFEASSLDSAMFSPEMLGIELNCIVECAELLDLYASVSVSKSQFMYPQVIDYGLIGKYDCDAKCDAEYGPEGNIIFKNGQTFDYRGVFCLHRKTLAEANYDLLAFMNQAVQRSYRINRNRALMIGDGVNEPEGWSTSNCFTQRVTGGTKVDHREVRLVIASTPMEYGPTTTIMHQNMLAHLMAQVDNTGRFLFGDGQLSYTVSGIRISNCLPDPTHNLTLDGDTKPFITGEFILAVGNWKTAYYAVNKRGLWMEQWEGGSTAWCVQYVFGAEDGGFVGCCPAVTVLRVGP